MVLDRRVAGAAVTGALAAGATLALVGYPVCLFGAGVALVVVAIVRSDLDSFRIPNACNALAAGLGLAAAAWSGQGEAVLAAARGLAAFSAFFLFRQLYRRLRGVDGLGLGDVKLAGVGAIWLDVADFALGLDLACTAALAYLLGRRWLRGEPLDRSRRLPFGAYLAPAIFIVWFLRHAQR